MNSTTSKTATKPTSKTPTRAAAKTTTKPAAKAEQKAATDPAPVRADMEATTAQQRLTMKLVAASKQVHAVSKDGSNDFQKYSFQSEAAIKAAVKPALESMGLTLIPRFEVLDQRDVPGKRGTNHIVDVMGTFTITDGVATLVGTMPGSGADTMEKAMAKACTTAQKYYLKQLFLISDQDTEGDADDSSQGAPYDPQPQYQQPNRPQYNNDYGQQTPPPDDSYMGGQQGGQQQESTELQSLLNLFKTAAGDTMDKKGIKQWSVMAKTIYGKAGIPSKPLESLTIDELHKLDKALDEYNREVPDAPRG